MKRNVVAMCMLLSFIRICRDDKTTFVCFALGLEVLPKLYWDDHKVDMHILDVYCKSTLLKHLRPDYEPNYNLFIYVTYSTVVPSTCVSISKPSGLGWPLASWAVRSKPETTVTA
ncbi:hypothetical protein V6N12_059265 [Hibiscus sabdariffa]|uniref:Uncharacterized protein n=1 Tax=Hibiscus sabdariffa TaxID=183260 RepID=A0ABR2EXR4_9ROSI